MTAIRRYARVKVPVSQFRKVVNFIGINIWVLHKVNNGYCGEQLSDGSPYSGALAVQYTNNGFMALL